MYIYVSYLYLQNIFVYIIMLPPLQRAKESLAKLEGMSSRASREEMKWGAVNPPSKVFARSVALCLSLYRSLALSLSRVCSLSLSLALSLYLYLSISLSISRALVRSLSPSLSVGMFGKGGEMKWGEPPLQDAFLLCHFQSVRLWKRRYWF